MSGVLVEIAQTPYCNDCPLYNVKSERRLAFLLKIDKRNLKQLQDDAQYQTFDKKVKNKTRTLNIPSLTLKIVQKRISKFLVTIPRPPWFCSTYPGTDYIKNACHHIPTSDFILKMDIKNYYPSTKGEYVFRFAKYSLCMVDDIAWVFTRLVTFKNSLPIGSPCSPIIGFWAYWQAFFKIADLASHNGYAMTLYVDDLTFSSNKPISKSFIYQVERELKRVGLQVKRNKTRLLTPEKVKIITGAAVSQNKELRIKNETRYSIIKKMEELKKADNDKRKAKIRESLLGMISNARRIEPDFMEHDLEKLLLQLRLPSK